MNINHVKEKLKEIQHNFNPEKPTYKILDEIIKGNYKPSQISKFLSSIKGVNKYPIELKNKFQDIVNDVNNLIVSERKEEEKRKQDANTRELKSLIDSLEKRDKKGIDALKKVTKSDSLNKENDLKVSDELKQKDKDKKEKQEVKVEVKKEIKEDNTKDVKKSFSKILLVLFLLSIVSIVLILLFY